MKINSTFFKNKTFIICISISITAIIIAITYAVGYKTAMNNFNKVLTEVNERQSMYAQLSEVDQIVRQNYVGQINEDKLKDCLSSGYISSLDEYYSLYLNADEYKIYSELQSSKYTDLGIKSIKANDCDIEVTDVAEGSPAQKSGIQKGDIITSIDSKKVRDIGYDRAMIILNRSIGETVDIEIIRTLPDPPYSETKTISVTYESYYKKPLTYKMLENNSIGKITISELSADSIKAFDLAVSELKANSAEKFILDLRNCKGEESLYAAKILDKILPEGTLINSVDKNGKSEVLYTSNSSEFQDPIVVLINSGTSGAGELVASAIKDFQKGEVIGQTTHGNTTMKKAYPLSDGSAIIISVSNYTTKSGNIITNNGVSPNKEVELSSEKRSLLDRYNLSDNDDDQLQSAIESLGGITYSKFLEMQEIAKAEEAAAKNLLSEENEATENQE